MVSTEKTIAVEPGTDLDRPLAAADGSTHILVRGDERYRISRDPQEDIGANYDPERVIQALRESAGALAHVDIEELKADLRAQRRQDSRGRPA